MPTVIQIALSFLILASGFVQVSSLLPRSMTGDVFAKGASAEPAVLPEAEIVLRGSETGETELDAQGAFAIDGPPPGPYQIEANAPSLCAALTVEVGAGTASTGPVEMNLAAVTSTTSATDTA